MRTGQRERKKESELEKRQEQTKTLSSGRQKVGRLAVSNVSAGLGASAAPACCLCCYCSEACVAAVAALAAGSLLYGCWGLTAATVSSCCALLFWRSRAH